MLSFVVFFSPSLNKGNFSTLSRKGEEISLPVAIAALKEELTWFSLV